MSEERKIYLANAFSLQMLKDQNNIVLFKEAEQPSQEELKKMVSAIGHQDLASILGVECKRINIALGEKDILYVAQLVGGRLPEGATTLPEGFALKWYRVQQVTKMNYKFQTKVNIGDNVSMNIEPEISIDVKELFNKEKVNID